MILQTKPLVIRLPDRNLELLRQNHEQRLAELQGEVVSLSLTPGQLLGHRTLSGSGTYTPTVGTKLLHVRMQAAGGAGGSAGGAGTGQAAGGGGNSGWYAEGWFTISKPVVAYTCGLGGVPGAAGANPGGTGGDTFALIDGVERRVKGGTGGNAAPVAATGIAGPAVFAGQILGGFDFIVCGQGEVISWTVAGVIFSGQGGASPMGVGGFALGPVTQAGVAGGIGAGGSGAVAFTSGNAAGGAGGDGLILIKEYS